MTDLMRNVDVLIGNEEDAEMVFGIKARGVDVTAGKLDRRQYEYVAKKLHDTFDFEIAAITLRESISASDNNWSAMLYDGKKHYFSSVYNIHIVDRVGGGDSFTGSLIYGILSGFPISEALEFAAAASCLKHTIHGDFNLVSVAEVQRLMGGDASGRVQR
jgi:2-dehydro-3-deoxygluconokinase